MSTSLLLSNGKKKRKNFKGEWGRKAYKNKRVEK
jgi:hypothetical protein